MAGPKNELMHLRHKLRDVTAMLGESEHARDHLRQQSNELKALALALVRKIKNRMAALDAAVGHLSPTDPIRITRDEWKAATDSDDVRAGKGVVLQVVKDEETGDVLVDLGDIEQVAPMPAKVGEA